MCIRTLIFLAAAASAADADGRESVPVRLEETVSSGARPFVAFPERPLELVARRPGGLQDVPELSGEARYASVALGRRRLHLAFDAPAGAFALGHLYTGAGKPAVGRARGDGKDGLLVDFRDVEAAGARIDVRLVYRGAQVSASLILARHRRGRATLGGGSREVILVDADGDGRYDGEDDRWVALRPNRALHMPTLKQAEALRLDEPQVPFEKDGRAFMVEQVKADGSGLVLVLDRPAKTVAAVLARRSDEIRGEYFRRFDREAATFRAKHGLDAGRGRVDEPARWRALPLSQARKVARKQGKPLLALFVTESNPWCFRYDYYTFRDREVDALLRRFVLVRIDAEKDAEQSYRRNGGRGLPALIPFRPDGGRVGFRVRHMRPDGTIEDLDADERLITGWQRPQDLAVNLERILAAIG